MKISKKFKKHIWLFVALIAMSLLYHLPKADPFYLTMFGKISLGGAWLGYIGHVIISNIKKGE